MSTRAACPLLVAALLMVLTGCAISPVALDPAPVPQIPEPRVSRIDAVVGVYYSPGFAIDPVYEKNALGITVIHRTGAANTALFDQLLAASFQRVVRLEQAPAKDTVPKGINAVIVPQLGYLRTHDDTLGGHNTLWMRLQIQVLSPTLEEIDAWDYTAIAQRPPGRGHERNYAPLYRAVAAQFLLDLNERPKLEALRGKPPEMPAPPTAATAPEVALLPASRGAQRWVECVSDALDDKTRARIVGADRFRDALFPWFETSTLPDTAEGLAQRIRRALAHAGTQSTLYPTLALIGGDTTNQFKGPFYCGGNAMGAGCLGAASGERKTVIRVAIWDLQRATQTTEFESSESGTSILLGLVLPIPLIAATEGRACELAASGLSQALDAHR